jgi:hypothetical protein
MEVHIDAICRLSNVMLTLRRELSDCFRRHARPPRQKLQAEAIEEAIGIRIGASPRKQHSLADQTLASVQRPHAQWQSVRPMNSIGEAGANEQSVDFGRIWVQGYAALPRCYGKQFLQLSNRTAAWYRICVCGLEGPTMFQLRSGSNQAQLTVCGFYGK